MLYSRDFDEIYYPKRTSLSSLTELGKCIYLLSISGTFKALATSVMHLLTEAWLTEAPLCSPISCW